MARLARFTQKVFAESATLGEKKKFGSLAAGAPADALTVADVQQLSNYLDGLFAGVVGPFNPAMEDMNSLFYMLTYQLAYSLQSGVPEWDSATEYFAGSIVTDTMLVASIAPTQAKLYVSLKANNTGNPLTDKTQWAVLFDNALNPQASVTLAARAAGNWIAKTASAANQWSSICYSPELQLFVAVSTAATPNAVMTSPDGNTWTARAVPGLLTPWDSVCWSPELGIFCAVAPNSVTTDMLMTSPDGITWTKHTSITRFWRSICWSPELGIFLAVDGGGTGNVMTSPDGITWTETSSGLTNSWFSVTWCSELLLFVAVAQSGAGRVMTSPDGTTWTLRTAPELNSWSSVVWSPELGVFVAVALTGTNRVMYSYNGVTWVAAAAAEANTWLEVSWSPELGVFVAVAGSGTNRVMYSYDGITWVAAAASAANSWISIAWAPQLGIFAAVESGGATAVMISKYVKRFTA